MQMEYMMKDYWLIIQRRKPNQKICHDGSIYQGQFIISLRNVGKRDLYNERLLYIYERDLTERKINGYVILFG